MLPGHPKAIRYEDTVERMFIGCGKRSVQLAPSVTLHLDTRAGPGLTSCGGNLPEWRERRLYVSHNIVPEHLYHYRRRIVRDHHPTSTQQRRHHRWQGRSRPELHRSKVGDVEL